MKPRLVLHPGFPKCATSTLQRFFVLNGCALKASLDVSVLGQNFLPDNGYPEVSKLMYYPEEFIRGVQSSDINSARAFYSNEALSLGREDVLGTIAERFEVARTVFTVRLPTLQSISSYCYSGWFRSMWSEFVSNPQANPVATLNRFRRKIAPFREISTSLSVCPTEEIGTSLEHRFLHECFGQVPETLALATQSGQGRANQSIPLAFAAALGEERQDLDFEIPGPHLNRLVKAAQSHALPEDLAKRKLIFRRGCHTGPFWMLVKTTELFLWNTGFPRSMPLKCLIEPCWMSIK